MRKFLCLIILISCGDDREWSGVYRKCLEERHYTTTTLMMVGKVMVPITNDHTECMKYSSNYFVKNFKNKTDYKLIKQ